MASLHANKNRITCILMFAQQYLYSCWPLRREILYFSLFTSFPCHWKPIFEGLFQGLSSPPTPIYFSSKATIFLFALKIDTSKNFLTIENIKNVLADRHSKSAKTTGSIIDPGYIYRTAPLKGFKAIQANIF